jgi:hypothetical protein
MCLPRCGRIIGSWLSRGWGGRVISVEKRISPLRGSQSALTAPVEMTVLPFRSLYRVGCRANIFGISAN